MIAPLAYLAALRVHGEGAAAFLDAQFTQRVSDLPSGELRLAAWCTPQGRVRALFRVLRDPAGGFALVLPRELAAETLAGLARFVMRAPVRVDTTLSDVFDASAADDAALARVCHGSHPQDPARRLAIAIDLTPGATPAIVESPACASAPGQLADASLAWRGADIRAGLPQIFAASSGLWLPQNLNLEALGGLSYAKGCYPGQEIVARLHYRGTVKQSLLLLECQHTAEDRLPGPGSALGDAAGAKLAEVVDATTDVASTQGAARALALAVVDDSVPALVLRSLEGGAAAAHWREAAPVKAPNVD